MAEEDEAPKINEVRIFAESSLQDLAQRMMDPGLGVKVEDKKWRTKTYENCFVASEAVTWLQQNAAVSRSDAVKLGQRLQRLGLFSHCLYEHTFKDEFLFFRFTGASAGASDEDKLPPGSFGAPVVGETLTLQGDVPGFFESRGEKFQGFFKSHLLFNKCVAFADAESMAIFCDDKIVHRENSMPPHWVDMFSGGNPANATVNMIDGDNHKRRKAALMACFSNQAMISYLPQVETVVQDHMKRWVLDGGSKMKWIPSIKAMCFEECCRFILGVEPSSELVKAFDDVMAAFAALPVKLPGSTLSAGLASRDKILELIKKGLARNKASTAPATNAIMYLLQQTGADPSLTDDIICYETLHFMIAGMAPVYTLHVYLLLELSRNPEVKEKVRQEILSKVASTSTPLSLETLSTLTFTDSVIKEVQRLHAGNAVPFSWGKIAADFSHSGFSIPSGWGGIGAFHACSHSSKVYENPEKFDPSRFLEPREEHLKHPCAFVPQGLVKNVEQTHGCAGYQMTEVMLKTFLVHLMKNYDWILLPKQKLNRNGASVPALPESGLKVKFFLKGDI